jgi:hypothetical protein
MPQRFVISVMLQHSRTIPFLNYISSNIIALRLPSIKELLELDLRRIVKIVNPQFVLEALLVKL